LEGNWENGGELKTQAICSLQKTKANDIEHFKNDHTDTFRDRTSPKYPMFHCLQSGDIFAYVNSNLKLEGSENEQ